MIRAGFQDLGGLVEGLPVHVRLLEDEQILFLALLAEIACRESRLPLIERFDFSLGVGLLICLEQAVFLLTFPVLFSGIGRFDLLRG